MSGLKDILYKTKRRIMLEKAWNRGLIKPFDEDLYERLSKVYVACLPLTIQLKYYKPEVGDFGDCYARSTYLTTGFDDATLVRGVRKDMEQAYGEGNGGHGWVENDGWVYDPTSLLMYRKDIYYKAYGVSDVTSYSKEVYSKSKLYQGIINTSIDDFKPGGDKRTDLIMIIPFTERIAQLKKDNGFIEELNEFLEEIEYDYESIIKELQEDMTKLNRR